MNFILIIPFALIISACSSDKNKEQKQVNQNLKPKTQTSFQTGIIIDNTKSKLNPSYSFSLYLPKNYSSKNKYPVIYIFDSHAHGKLPIVLYHELAEEFGYILIASNNSKNGLSPEISNNITSTLINECNKDFSIDLEQVYTMGFSGGARIASSIAINKGGIAGVIVCGAGLAGNTSLTNKSFHFMSLVGNEDFNYFEILNLNNHLTSMQIKNNICVFDGNHDWPDTEIMKEAFFWLELKSMQSGKKSVDSLLINSITEILETKILKAENDIQIIKQFEYNKKAINFLEGLADVTQYKLNIIKIENSRNYINAKQGQLEDISFETNLQYKYSQAFQSQSINWWKKEILRINKQIKTNKHQSLIYKRLLNYLSLISYMYSEQTIKSNDFLNAEKFLQIYELVDPTNSEVYYLKAIFHIKQGNKQKAIESLYQAINNGFEDLDRLNQEYDFISIKQTDEFRKITDKLDLKSHE